MGFMLLCDPFCRLAISNGWTIVIFANHSSGIRVGAVFVFVVSRFSIVRKTGDVKPLKRHEWSLCHALVHNHVAGFKRLTRRMSIFVHALFCKSGIEYGVGCIQFIVRFVLLVEPLHMAASSHLHRVLIDVCQLHLLKQLILLAAIQCAVCIDFVQLPGKLHLLREVPRIPVTGQTM